MFSFIINMPDEIIDIIFSYANVHCKTCHRYIQLMHKENWIIVKNNWFCSKECYNFI